MPLRHVTSLLERGQLREGYRQKRGFHLWLLSGVVLAYIMHLLYFFWGTYEPHEHI